MKSGSGNAVSVGTCQIRKTEKIVLIAITNGVVGVLILQGGRK